jgi:hypothetical protein
MQLKHKTLEELFAPIADAIREQTGESGVVIADDFPDVLKELFARLGSDVLTLSMDADGTPFTTVADLKAAVASAVAAIGPNATWAQVQYYIINNAVVDAETAQGASDANYWWTLDALPKLLKASYSVYGDGSKPNALDGLNINKVNNAPQQNELRFRKNTNGDKFADLEELRSALQTAINALKNFGFVTSTIQNVTWIELQHVMFGNIYALDSTLKNDPLINYWWWNSDIKPIGVTPDAAATIVAKAVQQSHEYFGEISLEEAKNVVAKYINGLNLQDNTGSSYSNVDTLYDALITMITEIFDRGLNDFVDVDATYIQMAWNEVQYYLKENDFATKESGLIPNYPWRPDYVLPILTLRDLLSAAYFVYGNGSQPTALDGLDMDQINNSPLWLRKTTDGDVFANEAEVKAGLQNVINKMVQRGEPFAGIIKITWLQVQYMMLGNGFRPNSSIAADIRINYWWLNGGSKPAGENPDVVILDILEMASKLDQENIGEGTDPTLLTALLSQYIAELHLKDAGGAEYTSPVVLQPIIQQMVRGVYDAWNTNFIDNVTYYVIMSWQEVQHYLITGLIEKEGTFPPYAWRPEYIPWPKVTPLTPLLEAMQQYIADSSVITLNQEVTIDKMRTVYCLYRAPNSPYVTAQLTTARNKMKSAATAAQDSEYYVTGKLKLDWYQLQYYIINNILVSPSAARTSDYAWAPAWAKTAYHTLLDEFLKAMETFAASDMSLTARNVLWAVIDNYYISNKLDIRVRASATTEIMMYDDLQTTTATKTLTKTRASNLATALKNNNISPYYDEATGRVLLTWYQLQYYSNSMNNITATATSIVSPEDAYAYYLTLGSHDWAPAWVAVNLEEAGA